MPKQRTREEMAAYQKARRLRVKPGVTPAQDVTPGPHFGVVVPILVTPGVTPDEKPVTPVPVVTPWVTPRVLPASMPRDALRERLDRLRGEYGRCQSAQDWDGCRAVNVERDPLFRALWAIEKGLGESERYWMPARYQNEGQSFEAKKVRA